MAACAGVQNVSRPIERCQEMSQMMPTFALVAATSVAATYQGRCAASGGAPGAGGAAPALGVLFTPAAGGQAPAPALLQESFSPPGCGGSPPPGGPSGPRRAWGT